MEKLLELEKKLREAKEELEKANNIIHDGEHLRIHAAKPGKEHKVVHKKTGESWHISHDLGGSIPEKHWNGPIEHEQIKAIENHYTPKLVKNSMMGYEEVNGSLAQSEKHPDEKEDKKLIAEALDTHNEKKHGEAKDKDSAFKDEKIEKSYQLGSIFEDDFEKSNSTTDKAQRIAPGARQPAYVRGVFGEKSKTAKVIDSIVSPNEQVKAQKDKASQNKAKAEAAAKERRAGYRKEGLLKSENITFDENGQWKL